MNPGELAELLRHKREAAGLEPEQLAARTFVPVYVIASWEVGGSGIQTIADYLTALEACGVVITIKTEPLRRT